MTEAEKKELQELHRLYNKHDVHGKTYTADGPRMWDEICICTCGDILIHNRVLENWEPLYGAVCVPIIIQNPELYPIIKAYWPTVSEYLESTGHIMDSWAMVMRDLPNELVNKYETKEEHQA